MDTRRAWWLSAALLGQGCFLFHGPGEAHGRPEVDAATPIDAARAQDAGPPAHDAGARDAGPLLPFRALAPENGAMTGSVHAERSLTPTFWWREAELFGGGYYELEVDDSCDRTSFRECGFPSVEARAQTTATKHTLESPLPVSRSAPVGTRYYWRVRVCSHGGEMCAPFTEVRYVDVGRMRNDYDGDGYAEVVIGTRSSSPSPEGDGESRAYVYRGGPAGIVAGSRRSLYMLGSPSSSAPSDDLFGGLLAAVGDVDGDGFSDLAVGASEGGLHWDGEGLEYPDAGYVRLYLGSAGGIDPAAPIRWIDAPNFARHRIHHLRALGDLDGDGYADVAVGDPNHTGGEGGGVLIAWGGAGVGEERTWIESPIIGDSATYFANLTSALGDVDGDGYVDLSVVSVGAEQDLTEWIVRGGRGRRLEAPVMVAHYPHHVSRCMGIYGGRDMNGDGIAERVAVTYEYEGGDVSSMISRVLGSYREGLVRTPDARMHFTRAEHRWGLVEAGDWWTNPLVAADRDGDGTSELYLPGYGSGPNGAARPAIVAIVDVGGRLERAHELTIPEPAGIDAALASGFGGPMAAGDVDGNGFEDLVICAHSPEDVDGCWVYYSGRGTSPAPTELRPEPGHDEFGISAT